MPYCRNCGARITKFEKDICPVCGTRNPLDGASSDTVEITSQLDLGAKENRKLYKAHFRLNTFIWFIFLGWTGAGFFYLAVKKRGLIWLICNVVVLAGLIALFAFVILDYKNWLAYAAPVSIVYLVNIGVAVYYLCKKDIKDGNGEFIH